MAHLKGFINTAQSLRNLARRCDTEKGFERVCREQREIAKTLRNGYPMALIIDNEKE